MGDTGKGDRDEGGVKGPPAWLEVQVPLACQSYLGKHGLSEPFCSKKGPLAPGVAGVDHWQANHFIVWRPETAAYLYGKTPPDPLNYRKGMLPHYEHVAERFAGHLRSAVEKATAFVCHALPAQILHPTIPPIGPYCRADRGLLDEPLLASGCGFCNEQARVFVRLCQVSGIPARLVYLFYADKVTGHTTAEFWTGEKWAMVDVSWYLVFPGPDGTLMSARDCHGDERQRLCLAAVYQARMRHLIALSDEDLCGRSLPPGTPDRSKLLVAKAQDRREYIRQLSSMERLAGHLWEFGILDYPLPEDDG